MLLFGELLPAALPVKDQGIQRICSSHFFGSLYQFLVSSFKLNFIFRLLVTIRTALPALS